MGAHAVVKRDADADPAVVLGAYPYAHAPVVAPAVHAFASVGAVAHVPVVKAVVEAPAEVTHEVAAHHVPLAVGYHGYGGYPYYGFLTLDGVRRSLNQTCHRFILPRNPDLVLYCSYYYHCCCCCLFSANFYEIV